MRQPRQNKGFTLIELMIVVAILGVLAAVAIASYTAYVRRSRNSEATAVLADIRLKQEAYRGAFHEYANGCGAWVPKASVSPEPMSASDISDPCKIAWRRLGVTLPNTLYFAYDTQAGLPNAAPTASRYSGAASARDFWYGAAAIEDLDGNNKCGGFAVVSGDIRMMELTEASGTCTY